MQNNLINLLKQRIIFFIKKDGKIYHTSSKDKENWWYYTSKKFIQYIYNNQYLLPKDGFYLILGSERTKFTDLSDFIPNNLFKILKKNNIKIGVSTKIEGDKDNILVIPNYFIFLDSEEYLQNLKLSDNNWDLKTNNLIYMGTLNSDFRKNILDSLKQYKFAKLFLRDDRNIDNVQYTEHLKYKFILDLPTDHEYNYDYSWSLWKKFLFKSLIFHVELPIKNSNYFFNILKDGEDWIICKNINDLIDKYFYFCEHQEKAKKIAENGYNKMLYIIKNYKDEYVKYMLKCKNDLNLLKYFLNAK